MEPQRRRTAVTALRGLATCAALCSLFACGSRSSLDGLALPRPNEESPSAPGAPSAPMKPPAAPVGGQPAVPTTPSMPMVPPEDHCEQVSLTIDDLRPTVTLLVDQSGSMRSGYPTRMSEQSRWTIVRQALLDEQTGVVQTLQHSLQFSLVFYTSHNGGPGNTCPILSQVSAATGNYAAIRELYDNSSPDDDTPTGPAVAQVVREIREAKRSGPEVILLVTDGDPDTCDVPDPQTDAAQAAAVSAAATAYQSGIDFYVLGVSDDISAEKLQQLANAGQGKPIQLRYGQDQDAAQPYQASSDVEGLKEQLKNILAQVPLCEVGLDRDVSPEEVASGRVVLDGRKLTLGADDGWRLTDPRHLQITGQACDELRAQGKRLTVRISCD